MPKIKLTKGELKKQRDSLRQYYRYLPTLQLKKQQIQIEILRQNAILDERRSAAAARKNEARAWAGLLSDPEVDLKGFLRPARVVTAAKNIAGVDIPLYEATEFGPAEYDLFIVPLWVDAAIEALRAVIALEREIAVLEEGVAVLRRELQVTTQRVNLFEKVKIPSAEEAIRRIKIYIGDQLANAVGRGKIAKRKIEAAELAEVAA